MKITGTHVKTALATLDAATTTYRASGNGLDRYSVPEQARRTAEARLAFTRAIAAASALAEAASLEATGEIERIDIWPDLAELHELIPSGQLADAASRWAFIREDIELMPADLLQRRLEHVVGGSDRVAKALHYRAVQRRLEQMVQANVLTRDARGQLAVPDGASTADVQIVALVGQLRSALVPASEQATRAEAVAVASADLNSRAMALNFDLERYGGQPVLAR